MYPVGHRQTGLSFPLRSFPGTHSALVPQGLSLHKSSGKKREVSRSLYVDAQICLWSRIRQSLIGSGEGGGFTWSEGSAKLEWISSHFFRAGADWGMISHFTLG